MKDTNKRLEQLFEHAGIWRAIFTMAVPAVVNILVMVMYNMADMFFVARMHDDAQVGAVSIVMPVFTMMMALGSLVGGGGCTLIAKTLGEKDETRVRLYSSLCCWGSIGFGAVSAVLILVFRESILGFLGANEDMWDYAGAYLSALALGAPAMIFTTAFGNIVRAEGAVKESMIGNLISTLTNVVLDPLFILSFHLGVTGAAVATVLGNLAGAAYFVWFIRRRSSTISLSWRDARSAPKEFGKVVALGLPNGVNSMLNSFASALANNLMVRYGTLAVAAMAAAGKSTTIITMVQMGICMGVQPLLAYNYGAKNLPRIKESVAELAILTTLVGLALTLVCLLWSADIVSLFLKDDEALRLGEQIIRLRVLTGPFMGLYYLSSSFLQASGNAPMSTFASLLRQGLFLIPLLFVMDRLFGVLGNVSAHMTADMLAMAAAVLLAVRQYRILRKTLPEQQPDKI